MANGSDYSWNQSPSYKGRYNIVCRLSLDFWCQETSNNKIFVTGHSFPKLSTWILLCLLPEARIGVGQSKEL